MKLAASSEAEQRHRISAAGDRHGYPLAGQNHPVALDGLEDSMVQRGSHGAEDFMSKTLSFRPRRTPAESFHPWRTILAMELAREQSDEPSTPGRDAAQSWFEDCCWRSSRVRAILASRVTAVK